MWQYNPDNPNMPRWKRDPKPILDSLVLQNSEPIAGPSTKKPGDRLNDVERALNYIKATLEELDRALNGVKQRLAGMAGTLNGNQSKPDQERIPPRFQAPYVIIAQNPTEYVPLEEDWEEEERIYLCDPEIDPAYPDDGPDTEDISWWDREPIIFGSREVRTLSQVPSAEELALGKKLDSEFVGYTADDKKSSPKGKGFEG